MFCFVSSCFFDRFCIRFVVMFGWLVCSVCFIVWLSRLWWLN